MSVLARARVGDMVELKDFQSVSDHEDDVIYTVSRVSKVMVRQTLLFTLFELNYDQRCMYISLDADAQHGEGYRLYYTPFPQLNRRDWLAEGGQWLFLPPPDADHFRADELELAPCPELPELEELGQMKRISYRLVGDPFFAEECAEEGEEVPLMMAEYQSDEHVLNPTMLLMERHWCDRQGQSYSTGGVLTLMVGCRLREDELVYHPVTAPVTKKKSWWRRG